MEPDTQIRTGQITLTPTAPQLREIKNGLGLLLDHLRNNRTRAHILQHQQYLDTRISTIYTLIKNLHHENLN